METPPQTNDNENNRSRFQMRSQELSDYLHNTPQHLSDKNRVAELQAAEAELPEIELITPAELAGLSAGTQLTSIYGKKVIVGQNDIDPDVRGGFLAYGFEIVDPTPEQTPPDSLDQLREVAAQAKRDHTQALEVAERAKITYLEAQAAIARIEEQTGNQAYPDTLPKSA